ncbi:hypothetical protein [Acinetobacter bereziniae]|nr:hypothetical protein [Acinetobacter bereziniae]
MNIIHIGLIIILISVVLIYFYSWYQDFKNWKYHKNKPRALNPWSDW